MALRWTLALTLLLAACGGDAPPAAGEATRQATTGEQGALRDSWMYAVASDPGRLEPFERGPAGDAWLNFFHNDLRRAALDFGAACTPSAAPLAERAAQSFACIGRARTHLELAEFYATIAEIDRVAQRQFFKHRRENPEQVLPSAHQPFFEGVVLLHSGERDAGVKLLQAYIDGGQGDAFLVALAGRIVGGLGHDPLIDRIWGGAAGKAPGGSFDDLPQTPATKAYRTRLEFVARLAADRFEGADALFRGVPHHQADFLESLKGSDSLLTPSIYQHDSAFLRAMSWYHAFDALQALGDAPGVGALRVAANRLLGRDPGDLGEPPTLSEGLALVLFGREASPLDLWAEQAGWPDRTALLKRLAPMVAAFAVPPSSDLADLDPFVKGSNLVKLGMGELLADAGPAGANMDSDMGLAERFDARVLMERAWQYQRTFDVRLDGDDGADLASAGVAVSSLMELVLDKTPSPPNPRLKAARVSFRNDPPFLADLARAHLDTRHPYDANEFVRPLTEIYPELIATREALAALDSAWNPARKGSVR